MCVIVLYFSEDYSFFLFLLQQFSKEIRQWQINVDVANDMARKLLRDYSADDTRNVQLMTDSINASWTAINKR